MLPYYSRRFDAVEAHSTYRRLPTPATVERWNACVPPEFRFAPKMHLGVTHQRDLDGLEDRVAAFAAAVAPLGERLGPVLVSLPHRHPDLERLERLLAAFSTLGPRAVAFELGPEWIVPAVIDRLEMHEATLALVDSDGRPASDVQVGPFTTSDCGVAATRGPSWTGGPTGWPRPGPTGATAISFSSTTSMPTAPGTLAG